MRFLSLFSSYYAIGFFLLSSDGPSAYLLPFKRAKKGEKREQEERKKNGKRTQLRWVIGGSEAGTTAGVE